MTNHCSTGCPNPGTHLSWGECVRAKRVQLADIEAHDNNTAIYRAQDNYRAAREDGLQPEGISPAEVAEARAITEMTGVPYRADQEFGGQPVEVE
jgi:hypothetical protein